MDFSWKYRHTSEKGIVKWKTVEQLGWSKFLFEGGRGREGKKSSRLREDENKGRNILLPGRILSPDKINPQQGLLYPDNILIFPTTVHKSQNIRFLPRQLFCLKESE